MQCCKIDLNNLPSSVTEFFSPEELSKMPEYEKHHLSSLRQNFEALRRAGLPVKPPEFMLRNKTEKEKRKILCPPMTESSEGSDSEWTPAIERPKKLPGQRTRPFDPPWKVNPRGNKSQIQVKTPSLPCRKKRRKQTNSKQNTFVEEVEEVHVYPFRKKRTTCYMSLKIPDDDDFLYCEECGTEYAGDCPEHGPLLIVDNSEVPSTCIKGTHQEYCRKTLPPGLVIKKSRIRNAGLGVFATKDFPVRTRFGPYGGKKEKDEETAHESGYCWQIFQDGKPSHFVDARDPCDSNWMRFVNCARSEEEQCVTAYQYKGEIYYRAHRHIHAGTEILVYYGDSYAKDLGIQEQRVGNLIRRTTEKVNHLGPLGESDDMYSCGYCYIAFSQPAFLELHLRRSHSNQYYETQQNMKNAFKSDHTDTISYSHESVCNQENNANSGNAGSKVLSLYENLEGPFAEVNLHGTLNISDSEFFVTDTISQTEKEYFMHDLRDVRIDDSDDVKLHKETDIGQKINNCDFCGMRFARRCDLPKHKMMHKRNNLYKCDECGKIFTESCNLQTHKGIHTGEKPYKCDLCGERFTQRGNLQKHKRTHTGEKPYKCDICGERFTESGHLQKHKRIHTGEKPYKCDVCGERFTQRGNLQKHKRIHTGEKPYKCDVCGKRFTESGHLQKHKRIHTGEKPYKCDVCGKRFTESGHLQKHKRIHTGEKPYKCDVCGKRFTESGHLQKHKRIHTGEKPYKCDVCGERFTQRGNLQKHKRIHTGEKPYKCDVCGKRFTESGHLQKHKRIHTGEKPYKCDVCGKRFRTSGHLQTHKRIHTGEKPYKCDVCGKRFARSFILQTHKRTHTGEKPYKCDVCGKRFRTSSDLQKHKRIHTGEKPYKCDVCGNRFAHNNSLQIHKKTHTRKKSYKCDV